MLQALVITLREGLEAFLIVAISIAYLRKSGRLELVPAVRWGIAAALAHPGRQVVVVTGDGAFGIDAMEIDSAKRHDAKAVIDRRA